MHYQMDCCLGRAGSPLHAWQGCEDSRIIPGWLGNADFALYAKRPHDEICLQTLLTGARIWRLRCKHGLLQQLRHDSWEVLVHSGQSGRVESSASRIMPTIVTKE